MFPHPFFAVVVLLAVLSSAVQALFIESPCCTAFPHMGAQFGPRLQFFSPGVRGSVSRSKSPQDCAGAEEGTVVLVDRHEGHAFVDIVRACQAKQVLAVIVRNQGSTAEDELVRMGGRADDIVVPAIFVSRRAGEKLDLDLLLQQQKEEKVIVQLYQADDLGYLYGTLLFVLPFMLVVMLFSCVFVALVRISVSRICQRRATRRRVVLVEQQQAPSTLNEPLMDGDVGDVEQQQEEKHFPIVLPNTTSSNNNSVAITLVNGEPVFDQQGQ